VIAQYYIALVQILAKIYQRENDLKSEETIYRKLFNQRQIFTNVTEAARIRHRLAEIALLTGRKDEYVRQLKLIVEAYTVSNSNNFK